jgi:hypothetical protein
MNFANLASSMAAAIRMPSPVYPFSADRTSDRLTPLAAGSAEHSVVHYLLRLMTDPAAPLPPLRRAVTLQMSNWPTVLRDDGTPAEPSLPALDQTQPSIRACP